MASVAERQHVCVIGNGAVGKLAALALSQAGLSVVLLGAATSLKKSTDANAWDVRVFALNRVAQTLLADVKVWGALDLARVQAVSAMKVADAGQGGAATSAALDFDAYGAHVEELAWIVEDKNLNHALDSALKFAKNLTQVYGAAHAMQIKSDVAEIVLGDGTQIQAELLVGADGAQSWLRGQCDIDIDYRSYGQRAIVTNFACEKPHHGVAHQWFTEDMGIIALLPLAGNQVSLVWSAPDALATQIEQESLSDLAQRLAVFCTAALGALTPLLPEELKSFPLQFLHPHTLIAPRVALVGDAAHVVHPLAGQGMNLGFADVADLVAVLSARETYRDCGDERVLQRYRRARKEDIALMQFATDGLTRLFASDLAAVRFGRQIGMNFLNNFSLLKRKLITHAMGK